MDNQPKALLDVLLGNPCVAETLMASASGTFLIDKTREDEFLPELDRACLRDGLLQPMPASFYASYPQNDLSVWCVRRGFYSLPTLELIDFLREQIGDDSAIEIGAGHGAMGRALGIPVTDSRMQEREEIAALYDLQGQAAVPYGPDVEKLTALEACEKYRPRVVLAAWVTHRWSREAPEREGNMFGVDENRLLSKPFVRRYIFVGHERIHGRKPLLEKRHATLRPPGLFARPLDSSANVVWIWKKVGPAGGL